MDQQTTSSGRIRGAHAFVPSPAGLVPEERRPKSISLGGLLDLKLPKREHLVFPWLRQRESAMIYAAPGVGKSFFAMSLALAVAGGGRVLGNWSASRSRRVLFVDGEMPIDDLQARAAMLLPAAGGYLEALRENLHFEARQYQPAGTIFTDLSSEASRETLLYKIKKARAELVILDNLSTLAAVDDENSAGDFNDTVKFLLRLKQEGVACLLIHHSNKSGESYRGSSKIATTFEAIMRLEAVDRKASDRPETTRFRLTWDKFRGKRDEKSGVPLDIALETAMFDGEGGIKAGQLQWISTAAEDARIDALLDLVRSCEYRNQRELAGALEVSPGTVNKWKAKAVELRRITLVEWDECLKKAKSADDDTGENTAHCSTEPAAEEDKPDF